MVEMTFIRKMEGPEMAAMGVEIPTLDTITEGITAVEMIVVMEGHTIAEEVVRVAGMVDVQLLVDVIVRAAHEVAAIDIVNKVTTKATIKNLQRMK